MDLHLGQRVGDYEVQAILDLGRSGPIYKVEQCFTRRTEVMKVLSAELASEIQIKRFQREIRVLSRLIHPNIALLHDAFNLGNQLILLTEFIEGQTLQSILSARDLPLERGVKYVNQILLAIRYAHEQGVVHRDLTPANIMVTAAGDVKLIDFGLSKAFGDSLLTNCGEILGSLPYLAPEHLKGTTHPDRRSDLYSVGAILYEILTGQKPFGTNRRLSAVLTDSEADPTPPSQLQPSLSASWDILICRAIARDPGHRYQSADEFLHAITELFDETHEFALPSFSYRGSILAILAGLFVVGVASPAIDALRLNTPAMIPLPEFHISAPVLAATRPVVSRKTSPTQPPSVATVPRHPSRTSAVLSRTVHPTPPVASLNADKSIGEPSPELSGPRTNVAQSIDDTAPAGQTEAATPEAAPRKNRRFWSRLNVFKRKNVDPPEKP